MMWSEPIKSACEAYASARRSQSSECTVLQVHIGSYLQAVKELRKRVAETGPIRMDRFDKAEAVTMEGLMDDLSGDEPLSGNS